MNYFTPREIPTTKQVNEGAAGAAASVTIAAPGAGKRTVIDKIVWSYSAAPTAGGLSITDNAVEVYDADITAAGPGCDGVPMPFGVNTAVVVTLAAPGGAVVAKLTVHSYAEQAAPGVATA